jgi:hypothetical protein
MQTRQAPVPVVASVIQLISSDNALSIWKRFNKRCDMEPRRPGIGRAAIALVVVVVIVGAVGLVAAGPRLFGPTANSSTVPASLTSSVSPPVSSTSAGPIQVLAPSVARLDPETSLNLNLNLTAKPNRSITVMAYDVNTLSTPNNVTIPSVWPTGPLRTCSDRVVIYAVYQGDYGTANYTQGTPLGYPGGDACEPVSYAIFSPLSSEAIMYAPPTNLNFVHFNASISDTLSGYTLGGNSSQPLEAFVPFPPGIYTVVAVDEWGNIVTSQFRVTTSYTATTMVLTTLAQDQLACENATPSAMPNGEVCVDLYGWAFVYGNSTVILDTATQQNPGNIELNITFSGLPSNSGFTGSVNLDQVLFPQCSCPFNEQFVHSPVLPNLEQGDEVKVTITGTSGLLFTATFTI